MELIFFEKVVEFEKQYNKHGICPKLVTREEHAVSRMSWRQMEVFIHVIFICWMITN